ncbi:MAG: HlyC/CorC family transporter [Clostridia bacterium]|nr:HlyC/CorC family transporter [Clostridia bacterium]
MKHIGLDIIIIFVMVVLSAWFSAAEMAFNSANPIRLKKRKESGSHAAGLALHICENFTHTLSVILVGNNLVNIAASTVMTVLMLASVKNESVSSILSTLIMTIVILLFGEITPKLLAKRFPEAFACFSAYPITVLRFILLPVTFPVMAFVNLLRKMWGKDQREEDPTVTEEDLSTIIDTVEEEGVIDESQSDILQSTLDFKDTTVYEVMTPRRNVIMLDISDPIEKNHEIISNSRYSRIPVFEDNVDHIIGILHLNQFYRAMAVDASDAGKSIRNNLTPALFVHKAMKLPAALEMLRMKHTHIAVVVDEFEGTLGIVTMEDILEELVGNIWDENDIVNKEFQNLGDGRYEVDGSMSIDDFFEEIDFEPEDFECEYTTMGGWAIEMLDADPHEGDSFTYENLTVQIKEMQGMRVLKLIVIVNEVDPEEEK